MKRLLFIYNPQAGKGIVKNHLANIVDIFTKADYLVTVWPTQGKEDATRVAARQGWWYDRVVCCGGDGTLSETVSGLLTLETPPVLGYLPAGTTNDFSRNLGLPRGLEKAALTAVEGTPRPCDMGRFNDLYFVYVAAFGIFTDVPYETPQEDKRIWGRLAYIMNGAGALGRLKPTHVRVSYDDHQEEADVLVGLVTSTTSVGGFKTTRDLGISLNDGLYEMILVRATKNLAEFNLAATRALRLDFDNDSFISAQTGALRFEFDEPVAWTVDGEFGGSVTEVEIHNERRAIDIIVP